MSHDSKRSRSAGDAARSPWDETTPVLDGWPWADVAQDSDEMRAWLEAHTPNGRLLRKLQAIGAGK